jgi:hypothetical protein
MSDAMKSERQSTINKIERCKRNARRYPPPPNHPDDQLLNVSAVCVEVGIVPDRFSARQKAGWPGWGYTRRLTAYPVQYAHPAFGTMTENAYLLSEVKEAIQEPPSTYGLRQKPGEPDRLGSAATRRELGVKRFSLGTTAARMALEATAGKSPETGKRENQYVRDRVLQAKEKRRDRLPDRVEGKEKDPVTGKKPIGLRSDLAAKKLAAARLKRKDGRRLDDLSDVDRERAVVSADTSLKQWLRRCPLLGGNKLRKVEIDRDKLFYTRGRVRSYYDETDFNAILRQLLSPVTAAPGYLTLTEAVAATKKGPGPRLSRAFLFRNREESEFVKGGLQAVLRTPPSLTGKGKPQWEVRPDNLRELQDAVRDAEREAARPLPPGFGTVQDVERRCAVRDMAQRIRLNARLREWAADGRLDSREVWRFRKRTFLKDADALRHAVLYDLEGAARLWKQNQQQAAPQTDKPLPTPPDDAAASGAVTRPPTGTKPDEMLAPRETPPRTPPRRKRGRPKGRVDEEVAERNRKMLAAWNAGQFTSVAALARAFHVDRTLASKLVNAAHLKA